jgi:hypothetical protein
LPNIVIRSRQFADLSAHATKLLVDLLAQYNGSNNGDLCATWSVMQERAWKSRDTLAKALKELLDTGFVTQTRQGGRHAPSLYAVTFYALDANSKLDVGPDSYPRGAWARGEPGDGAERRKRWHAGRVNSPSINTPAVPRTMAEAAN